MIEAGLTAYLQAHAVIGPLLSSGQLRLFPLIIPEHLRGEKNKQPCIVYQRTASYRGQTFCSTDTLCNAEMQLDVYALSYLEAKQIADLLRPALVDYTGAMGDTRVDRVLMGNEFDLVESDTGLFRVSQTYSIWFYE